jgi:fido (protein-threonine AMPylation protein)
LHDKLEYYNISKTLDYIKDSNIWEIIKKKWINNEIILDIHKKLTIWLDELFLGKLEWYDPYFSWEFRNENNIKVWNKKVINFELIKEKLDKIYNLTKNIFSLNEVFHLHANLYYIHPFSNWNKRVCRILEEIYIENLWINSSISASHWYYLHQRLYTKQIYQKTIRKQLFESFSDFGYASLIISWIYLLHNQLSAIKREIIKPYNLEIFKNFIEWETLKTKDLEKEITKKLKISSRTFFIKLAKEKEVLQDLIEEEKIWRNIFYNLNLNDKKYLKIKNKIYELWAEYKKYNIAYSEINFMKNYKF